ncbi:MAG: 2,3-dimethylmalate dehydratase small subunit [Actinobacteria bacterium]|uniref:LeuD/DmdB family oxidoreductase small subunit n=1 Tax=Candidatus Hakubella thermalkaliphila TaxID=2754717 RepID=UPI0015936F0A|nr:3-isopropylmalate dehydratase [Candidatus Hakubella thermalkaliphila]MBT9170426.1 2,3-dimethylmalate dehydratase small subunit [Actinomycetota bacterium]
MVLTGVARKFDLDDINTDYIISGKYKFKTLDMKELVRHLMEDLDPHFMERIGPGDFLVAGENFGCGSSREQAPLVIREAGLGAVIAKSFAPIFFRNSINTGLPVIEGDTSLIDEGDKLVLDLRAGIIQNIDKGLDIKIRPLPEIMLRILNDGGLAGHLIKHKGFAI